MTRSLRTRYLKPGTPEAQVVALVGKPDTIHTGNIDEGGNRLPGTQTYAYWLGGPHTGFDSTFLYVHLDQNDRVISTEINGF